MQPEFLYHYTSIEALASILKNRTIRFNKLNRVDDVTEGKSHDFDYISEYFFISCWTDLEEESIPFWNMYTPGMKEVRIKLPSSLFNKCGFLTDGSDGLQTTLVYSLIPKHQTFGNNFWIVPTHNNYLWNVLDRQFDVISQKLIFKNVYNSILFVNHAQRDVYVKKLKSKYCKYIL